MDHSIYTFCCLPHIFHHSSHFPLIPFSIFNLKQKPKIKRSVTKQTPGSCIWIRNYWDHLFFKAFLRDSYSKSSVLFQVSEIPVWKPWNIKYRDLLLTAVSSRTSFYNFWVFQLRYLKRPKYGLVFHFNYKLWNTVLSCKSIEFFDFRYALCSKVNKGHMKISET